MSDFEEIYAHAIIVSRNLIEDIRFSREVNLDVIQKCSYQLCDYLCTDKNILNLLSSVSEHNLYLHSHPVNVAIVSFVIGKWMNLKYEELSKLVFTGLVHDIGKAKIRDSLLNKPEKLTGDEMRNIRNHPMFGYRLMAGFDITDRDILMGVLSHHERMDGTGYPSQSKGSQISKFGRIIAIADIYVAMTSTRPYREKINPFKAIEEIQELSFSLLDPLICQVFLNNIINYYYGNTVRLNNERVGTIIYLNPEERTKPIIHCENEYINLTLERDLEIVEMLST